MNMQIFCGKYGCEGLLFFEGIGQSGFGITKPEQDTQWDEMRPVVQRFFDEHRHEGEGVADDDDESGGGPLGPVTGEDPASDE